jgi:hypothetical protein
MSMSFTTPEEVNAYRVITGIHAIALEINTGMKPTRGFSAQRFAAGYGYPGSNNKKKVLQWLVENTGYEVKPGSGVEKALNS